jgi:hypothetical protein
LNKNGWGRGISRQAGLITRKLPTTAWNVSCHRVWQYRLERVWARHPIGIIAAGSNPCPAKKGETNMIKLSAFNAMFWGTITGFVMHWLYFTAMECIAMSALTFIVTFVVTLFISSLC